MKNNIGKLDKKVRYFLAIIIAIAGIYFKSWWGLIAFLPLITAYFSICPLYKIFGLNTCGSNSVQ
jgi:hypothetical protein